MSPRAVGILIAVLLALTGVGVTWLFWVQNSARRVMLNLNLGFVQLDLIEPMPAPVLMAICLGVGFVLGVVLVLAMRLGGRRRNRESLQGPPYGSGDYGSAGLDSGAAGDRGY